MKDTVMIIFILALLSGCVSISECTDCEIHIDDNDTPTTTTSVTAIP